MASLSTDVPLGEVFKFVAKRVGCTPSAFYLATGAGLVDNDGEMRGAVVFFNQYRMEHGLSIELCAALDRPGLLTQHIIEQMLDYAFNQAGATVLVAKTAATNRRARTALRRLGFKLDGTLRRMHDGATDQCVYSLLPGACEIMHKET